MKHLETTALATDCHQQLANFVYQYGDKGSAFLSIVARYIKHCSHKYYPLSPEEQQDMLQEVGIKVLLHHDKLQDNCSAWLYSIVRNEYFDCSRKKQAQANLLKTFGQWARQVVPHTHEQQQKYLTHDSFEYIDCLEHIFDVIEQQETGEMDMSIYTQFAKGDSYEEISASTGRTVNAIGKRISTLRQRLKKLKQNLC